VRAEGRRCRLHRVARDSNVVVDRQTIEDSPSSPTKRRQTVVATFARLDVVHVDALVG
jgi:hypothetical protein